MQFLSISAQFLSIPLHFFINTSLHFHFTSFQLCSISSLRNSLLIIFISCPLNSCHIIYYQFQRNSCRIFSQHLQFKSNVVISFPSHYYSALGPSFSVLFCTKPFLFDSFLISSYPVQNNSVPVHSCSAHVTTLLF